MIKPIMAGIVIGLIVIIWTINEVLLWKKPINLEKIIKAKNEYEQKESIIKKRKLKEVV
ncbi:hypothetical protein [Williamsoniiplasma luminosum]|uniref:hypothetical protein n=1 Tax=Williamsoniiplasma luminosum TaxID=214888 RepID=UPI0026DA366E|nr:hypothetical protein [Williamsoniiplasma luminosum]